MRELSRPAPVDPPPFVLNGISSMPMAEYLALPALSSGVCHTLAMESPIHGWHESYLNPARSNDVANTISIGEAAHSLVLENDASKIVTLDFKDYRKDAAQAARDEAIAAGLTPLLPHQLAIAYAMAEAAREFIGRSEIASAFRDGNPELVMQWNQEGVTCKARPDWLSTDGQWLIHLKTGATANPKLWVRRNFTAMGYDVAAAFYHLGALACGAPMTIKTRFLVQEQKAPFQCCVIRPSSAAMEVATSKVRRGLLAWKRGIETNVWPGYGTDTFEADITPWEFEAEEQYL